MMCLLLAVQPVYKLLTVIDYLILLVILVLFVG